jgi:heat shock protein HslJ
MNRTRAAAVVIAAFVAAGCTATADKERGAGARLADTRWTLQSLGEASVPRHPPVTLDLGRDGHVSGSDGCNRLQTVYTVDGASISISMKVAGTMMACPEQIEARARTYREALQRAARFTLSEDRLSLQDSTGRVLAAFVPSIKALAGTRWDVVAYNNGRGGVVSVLAGTRMSASFEKDGQVTGSAGCNRYFAGYQQQAERLTIGLAATTRKFCAEPVGVMQQEALFLEVLRTSATLVLEGNRLELRKSDGALAVVLDRQPDH